MLFCSTLRAVRVGVYGGQISGFQLVTANFGWVYGDGKLLRTVDGGATWTDISPPLAAGEGMGNIFFLDPQHGWAVTAREKQDGSGESISRTWTTGDGGTMWHPHPMSLDCWACAQNSFISDLSFIDPQHGWVLFDVGGNIRSGVLFATADGGRTWAKLSTPFSGRLRFINRFDGWLVSSQMTGAPLELYATRDGGRSWQRQTFEVPAGLNISDAAFDPPTFTTPRSGTLAVAFVSNIALGHYRSVVALYRTEDGGLHWTTNRVFPATEAVVPAPVIARQQAIWASVQDGHVVTMHDGVENRSSKPIPPLVVQGVQFADSRHGWILAGGGGCREFKCDCMQESGLLVTADGGATLRMAQPPLAPAPMISPCGSNESKQRPEGTLR